MQADIYTTIAGDTWDMIAFKVYGDEHVFDRLIAANPAYREVMRFDAGCEITCPDIEVAVSNALPPWKT
jgi:phage tail protein X